MSHVPLATAALHLAATLDERTSQAGRLGSIPFRRRHPIRLVQARVAALWLAMTRIAPLRHRRGGNRGSSANIGKYTHIIGISHNLMGLGSLQGIALTVCHGLDSSQERFVWYSTYFIAFNLLLASELILFLHISI
jgi:hypothetical protein